MVPVRRVCVANEYTVGPFACVSLPKIYATRNNSFLKSGLSEYVLKHALSVVGCCGHETVLHILQTSYANKLRLLQTPHGSKRTEVRVRRKI